jgi:hypothetical protein
MEQLHQNIGVNPIEASPSLGEAHHRSPSDGAQFGPLCFIAVKTLATNEHAYLLLFLAVAKEKENKEE